MTTSKNRFNPWLFGWIPLGFYTAFIIHGALVPADEIPPFFLKLPDWVWHAGEYFLLFFFAVNAFGRSRMSWLLRFPGPSAALYGLALGILTEWLQSFTPDRSAEARDWMWDAGGILAAFLIYRSLLKKFFPAKINSF